MVAPGPWPFPTAKDKQEKTEELISVREAVERGIDRLRLPKWADPFDHVKIDIIEVGGKKGYGPWMHLYAPFNQECNGSDPVDMLLLANLKFDPDAKEYLPYTGPLPDSEEYKERVKGFEGVLSRR
jgi:hypothetical protein